MSFNSFYSSLSMSLNSRQQILNVNFGRTKRLYCIEKNCHGEYCKLGTRLFSSTSSAKGKQRPIFVAATKQHVGKTTTCLAVLSGLQKRFENVGFLR